MTRAGSDPIAKKGPDVEELAIGVIGTGNIGTDHIRRIGREIAGAKVVAVFDVDQARAAPVGAEAGARSLARAEDVVEDPAVQAVLICSPGPTHAALVLACLEAGKPVLCEKPLAPTVEECLAVVRAEVDHGARLVQVGFMRRFDPGYVALKQTLDSGELGDLVLTHCVHRNVASAPGISSDMLITDSAIHELDVLAWLLGEELVAATVVTGRPSPKAESGLLDPQLVLLESQSGTICEVEVFVNCQYGYDVRCEVVGSLGAASLESPPSTTLTVAGQRRQALHQDWRPRFADAYRIELQSWVDGVHDKTTGSPSAFDGYRATAVAKACVESLRSGGRVEVERVERPGLYR
jgi:myo-inositol 2-dehydrogenase/D-chiro-inositol 1-dehydrogenase